MNWAEGQIGPKRLTTKQISKDGKTAFNAYIYYPGDLMPPPAWNYTDWTAEVSVCNWPGGWENRPEWFYKKHPGGELLEVVHWAEVTLRDMVEFWENKEWQHIKSNT